MQADVVLPAGRVELEGSLEVPSGARGVVAFAHGSGSSRHSPRNQAVAASLREAGLGTVLFDLLTEDEERLDARTGELRFDIALLAERVAAAGAWVAGRPEAAGMGLGYFGASTGAAAALVAAAGAPGNVRGVVSRGGRPDLAGDALPEVRVPTLLIVGSLDEAVIDMNREAMARMRGPVELKIVEGASHLFEEPGTLERVAELARDWFLHHLPG